MGASAAAPTPEPARRPDRASCDAMPTPASPSRAGALEIRGSADGLLDEPFLLRVRGAGPDAGLTLARPLPRRRRPRLASQRRARRGARRILVAREGLDRPRRGPALAASGHDRGSRRGRRRPRGGARDHAPAGGRGRAHAALARRPRRDVARAGAAAAVCDGPRRRYRRPGAAGRRRSSPHRCSPRAACLRSWSPEGGAPATRSPSRRSACTPSRRHGSRSSCCAALDPFGDEHGGGVVLPPGVGARASRAATAARAAAWDELLARLGATPRARPEGGVSI